MPQANAHSTRFDQDDVNETIPLIPEDILRQHHCLEPDVKVHLRCPPAAIPLAARSEPAGRSPPQSVRGNSSDRLPSHHVVRPRRANFLDPAIASLVRRELVYREIGALIDADRLFRNLLSSMPLVFNLFGPLKRDPEFATRVMRLVLPGFNGTITNILFEHSPGRGNPAFSADYIPSPKGEGFTDPLSGTLN